MTSVLSVLSAYIVPFAMLAVIIIGRFIFGVLARVNRYSLSEQMVVFDNPAIGIRFGFFTLAVLLSFTTVVHPSGISLRADLDLVGVYSLIVIAMLIASQYVNDYAILYYVRNDREVVDKKNCAVAAVEGSTYLATALIFSGAIAGWEGGFGISFGWFAIGQAFLVCLALLYRALVPKVFDALHACNLAAGISFGGFLISGGILLGSAVSGQFHGWGEDLISVGFFVLAWLPLMLVAHLVTDRLLLHGSRLRKEIMEDRNTAAGLIEAVVFVGTTLVFIKVWG